MAKIWWAIFLGLLCLALAQAEDKAENVADDSTQKLDIDTDRLVVCLLLFYYRWNNISSIEYITTEDSDLNSDIKYKIKALMLSKCFKEMPQELATQVF